MDSLDPESDSLDPDELPEEDPDELDSGASAAPPRTSRTHC